MVVETNTIVQEIKIILGRMGFGEADIGSIEVHQGAATRISVWVHGRETYDESGQGAGRISSANLLIGERGSTLGSLEHIVKKIVRQKHGTEYKFTLDVNDYRVKRLDDLKQDVKTAAKEVRLYGKEVPLRSMSSFERRIVHLLLAEYPDIATESIGQEPNRMVVIKPYP